MATIPIYYEAPLVLFAVFGMFTIYKLFKVRSYLSEGSLKDSFSWFSASSILLVLWSLSHIYDDLIIPSGIWLKDFSHYVISHGFLLIAIICIAIAANKIQTAYSSLNSKLDLNRNKEVVEGKKK